MLNVHNVLASSQVPGRRFAGIPSSQRSPRIDCGHPPAPDPLITSARTVAVEVGFEPGGVAPSHAFEDCAASSTTGRECT
jgi:hypothetical protein